MLKIILGGCDFLHSIRFIGHKKVKDFHVNEK